MPTIAIYFDAPGAKDYPFNKADYYTSYLEFSHFAEERGAHIVFVRGTSYTGGMRFTSGWHFQDSELVEIPTEITADVIYNKASGPAFTNNYTDFIVNHPDLDSCALDKWKTYELLREHMPATELLTPENWQEALANVPGEQAVLKPQFGLEGHGIFFVKKSDFSYEKHTFAEPYLVQQFIDTSKGIPALTEGHHDLRLILFNHEVKLSYLRIPKSGSLLANASQGATTQAVPLDRLPHQAVETALKADTHFSQYSPRIYTIDFMFEGDKPYICEINSRPAMPTSQGPHYTQTYYQSLLKVLLDGIRERSNSTS